MQSFFRIRFISLFVEAFGFSDTHHETDTTHIEARNLWVMGNNKLSSQTDFFG